MLKKSYPEGVFKKPGSKWIERLVYLMDEQFQIPGTRFRFGFDPLMNLFPVVGDMTGFMIGAGLLLAMARKGAGNKLVVLMSINIFLDATIGAIPVAGQIFDFFFKSNSRNLKLMKEHYVEGKHQGSGQNTLVLALIILAVIFILLIVLLWKIGEWILSAFSW
jgi:NAD/NADP transhydrogenase beta subunit